MFLEQKICTLSLNRLKMTTILSKTLSGVKIMVSVIAFFVTFAGFIGAVLHFTGIITSPPLEVCLIIGVAGAVVSMMTRRTSN